MPITRVALEVQAHAGAEILQRLGLAGGHVNLRRSCFRMCSTDTDTRIGIGRIRIRGYVKFLQKLKAQRCIGVSDTDTRIRIGYVICGHVEVSGLYKF